MSEPPAGGWWQDERGKWRKDKRPAAPSPGPEDAPNLPPIPPKSAPPRKAKKDRKPASTPGSHSAAEAEVGTGRLGEITQQIAHLPGGQGFLGRREVKQLPAILWEDERVENIIRGFYANGTGILVATNKRLVFVDKGVAKLRVEDFPYDKITSIQYNLGFAGGTLTIFASGNKADIQHVPKDQCKTFGDFVRARITGASRHASLDASPVAAPSPAAPPTRGDVIDQLERLTKLRDQGALTEEEFQAQKGKVLDG
jgi:hypothetical protein